MSTLARVRSSLARRSTAAFGRIYWPARRAAWRWRWFVLRRRVRLQARMVDSRVTFDIAPTARLGRRATVEVLPGTTSRLVFRDGSWMGDDVYLQLSGGTLTVGDQTILRAGLRVTLGGDLRLGARLVISWATSLHCAERLDIGDDTIIGEYSVITDSRHVRTGGDVPIRDHVAAAATQIADNCWIGAHAVVGAGVQVGSHAFIGAMSVVTKDVPAWWFAAGAPAKPVRQLEIEAS
jgi:acetyltransferase-like isoleucine patch superfamily enzyme